MYKNIKNRRILGGFTLVETLVAIFIFTLIFSVLMGLIVASYRNYGYAQEQSLAIDEARRGIEIMVREIREAKTADNGAFPIERADDKQVVFYSDIDDDGKTERVRYFLGTVTSENEIQECTTTSGGGTCSVTFSNLLRGTLKSAQVRVSVDGDLDNSNEYVTVTADGTTLGDLCRTSCLHCAGAWQGLAVFDVTSQIMDNSITFLADASSRVGRECPVGSPNYAMKARFELTWSEEVIGLGNELRKGIIKPVGDPIEYPTDQETVYVITPYVRNDPPIFEYYNSDGEKITEALLRLVDTKLVKTYLVINIDPNRPPTEFQLQSAVQLRNLKAE